jgi:hypothetical protein
MNRHRRVGTTHGSRRSAIMTHSPNSSSSSSSSTSEKFGADCTSARGHHSLSRAFLRGSMGTVPPGRLQQRSLALRLSLSACLPAACLPTSPSLLFQIQTYDIRMALAKPSKQSPQMKPYPRNNSQEEVLLFRRYCKINSSVFGIRNLKFTRYPVPA